MIQYPQMLFFMSKSKCLYLFKFVKFIKTLKALLDRFWLKRKRNWAIYWIFWFVFKKKLRRSSKVWKGINEQFWYKETYIYRISSTFLFCTRGCDVNSKKEKYILVKVCSYMYMFFFKKMLVFFNIFFS